MRNSVKKYHTYIHKIAENVFVGPIKLAGKFEVLILLLTS